MLIMKIALLSCAFYLAFALAMELALYALMFRKDTIGISFTQTGWIVWSGAIWLASTTLAFRLVVIGIRAKLSGR